MTGEGGETMNGCQSLDMGDAKDGEGVRGGLSGATGKGGALAQARCTLYCRKAHVWLGCG
jgi:hypothetical protein